MSSMRYLLRPIRTVVAVFPAARGAVSTWTGLGVAPSSSSPPGLGMTTTFWASLIMPFAGLARLGSYVAMFLVLRFGHSRAGRAAQAIGPTESTCSPTSSCRSSPSTWHGNCSQRIGSRSRMLRAPVSDCREEHGIDPETGTELHPGMPPSQHRHLGHHRGLHLSVRFALGRFKDRLPGWMARGPGEMSDALVGVPGL